MNKWRYSFAAGALVGAVGVAALLFGLPGVQADGDAPVVAVRASDSRYQGVPGTVKVGETRFSFTNESETEGHEMSLFRINDGVKEPFDQILAEDEARLTQESAQPAPDQPAADNPPADDSPPPAPRMTFFGATGAGPGESSRMDLIGDLPAGRYGIVCFIPSSDETGTPQWKKGMEAEFTVR